MANFQDWILADYAACPVKHLIGAEEYVELVTKNQPSVTDDDIYDPIVVQLQLCGSKAVPVQIDYSPSWYPRLCKAVSDMCNVRDDVELKDIRGRCIKDTSAFELERVGKVKAFTRNGKRINMPVLPEPPHHMSNDKIEKLCNWFDTDIRNDIVCTIADELKDSSKTDLRIKTAENSELHKKLAAVINDKMADTFLATYGSNERARATSNADAAHACAKTVLAQLRQRLRGAVNKIERHLAAKATLALGDNAEDLFGEDVNVAEHLTDEREMYEKLARKALANKMDIINNVYRATPLIACNTCDKSKKKNKKEGDKDYYREYYYGNDVYQRYQQFTGASVFMEPGLRGARLRKKLANQVETERKRETSTLKRVEPRLVVEQKGVTPIAQASAPPPPPLKRVDPRQVDRNPFPGVEPIARRVERKHTFPGVEPIVRAVERKPFPGVEPIAREQSPLKRVERKPIAHQVERKPFPGVEPIAREVQRKPFPGVEPIAPELSPLKRVERKPIARQVERKPFPGVEPIARKMERKPFPGVEPIAREVERKQSFPGVEPIAPELSPLKRVERKPVPGVKPIAREVSVKASVDEEVPRINDGRPDIFDY